MDYEYEPDDEDYAPRILWARIAFWVGGVVIAFIFGACTFGGGSSDLEDRVAQLEGTNSELESQIETLESQNTALSDRLAADEGDGEEDGDGDADGNGTSADEDEGDEDGSDADGGEIDDGEDRSYVVQEGDTLGTIAQRFYGDSSQIEPIQQANNLDSTNLQIGQELTIPALD